MINVEMTSIVKLLGEAEDLFDNHWDEVPLLDHKDIGLDIDKTSLVMLEEMGNLAVCVAKDEEAIVGYLVVIADNAIQHKNHIIATDEVIYVHPDYRKKGVAKLMIDKMEEHLKENGVHFFQLVVNMNYDWSALPEALGYSLSNKSYMKRLN